MMVLVENIEQLDYIANNRERFEGAVIFCCNETLREIFALNGIKYTEYNKYAQELDANKINSWARITASKWSRDSVINDILDVNDINCGDLDWLYFAGNCVWFLVNHMVIEAILDEYNPDKVFVFPDCEINAMLEKIAGLRRIVVETLTLTKRIRVKIDLPAITKSLFSGMFGLLSNIRHKAHDKSVMVSGTLGYLSSITESLGHECPVIMFEQRFRRKQYIFCRENNIRYVTQPMDFSLSRLLNSRSHRKRILRGRQTLLKRMKEISVFIFSGKNMDLMYDFMLTNFLSRIKDCVDNILVTDAILKRHNFSAVILDEDHTHVKRSIALQADKKYKIPVFVVSHGVPYNNFTVPGDFAPSPMCKTLVNSRFEKEKYCMLGWDPEKVLVLGSPRYDEIIKKKKTGNVSGGYKILYCADYLHKDENRKVGFFRPQSNNYITRENALSIMEAVKDIDCELMIKPHYSHDTNAWKELVRKYGNKKVILLPAASNIVGLLIGMDLLLTATSTVIIEALLLDKDVVSVNFTDEPAIHTYAEHGVIMEVRRPEDLSGAIKKCMEDDRVKSELKNRRKDHFEYYCGFADMKNTQRVSECILSGIKDTL